MRILRFAFAGDRDISVWVLDFILSQDARPVALLISEEASHADQLIGLCPFLKEDRILKGKRFRQPEGTDLLRNLDLDYIICVHFPYIVPENVLSLPRVGVLNLHPAYLPYNRGWHTPSWALLENTPIGATLHFMDVGVDTGDIIHQKQLKVSPDDTANALYQRLKRYELEVFKEAWPGLVSGSYMRSPQKRQEGSSHKRQELFSDEIQRIDLNQFVKAGDLIQRLRALTTNCPDESAYYEIDGKRYGIQVTVHEKK